MVAVRTAVEPVVAGSAMRRPTAPRSGCSVEYDGDAADVTSVLNAAPAEGVPSSEFAVVNAWGRAELPAGAVRFDDARNWALVAALVSDTNSCASADDQDDLEDIEDDAEVGVDHPSCLHVSSPVQYVMTARAIRRRLLAYAERIGAPSETVERASSAMYSPRHGDPHRDHFHVRILCAPDDRPACRDLPPYRGWYDDTHDFTF